jgi:hypothetical protein
MSIRTFVTADTHWGHASICEFNSKHGAALRPWATPEEMDEAMVTLWNETVRPVDNVIHLGDVAKQKRHVETMSRCNGRKILVKGNHDTFDLATYTPHFVDIAGVHVVKSEGMKFLLTHIPVHERGKDRYDGNIHGHLHSQTMGDPWFQCVSVEQTGFRPILLDEVISRYK